MGRKFVFVTGDCFEKCLENPYPSCQGLKKIKQGYNIACDKDAEAIIVGGKRTHPKTGESFGCLAKQFITGHDSSVKVIEGQGKTDFPPNIYGDCQFLAQVLFKQIDEEKLSKRVHQEFKIFIVATTKQLKKAKQFLRPLLKSLHNDLVVFDVVPCSVDKGFFLKSFGKIKGLIKMFLWS